MDNDKIKEDGRLPEMSEEIEKYLQALILEKGVKTLPGHVLASIMYDLYVRFIDYLFINVAKAMPKEKFNEFEDLLDEETDQAKIESYIKENVDYKKVMDETFTEFRETFLSTKQTK